MPHHRRCRAWVAACVLLAVCTAGLSSAIGWAKPKPALDQAPARTNLTGSPPPYPCHRLFFLSAIRGYQWVFSEARGTSCPMHPHCSEYGREAFTEAGALPAVMMTADRLLRCGNDLNHYDLVRVGHALRYADPLPRARGGVADDEPWWNAPVHPLLAQAHTESDTKPPHAATPPANDSLQLGFANWLQERGDFDRAITEYQRLIFSAPYTRWSRKAEDDLMGCYYQSGQYTEAFDLGISLLDRDLDNDRRDRVLLAVGKSSIRRGDYGGARFHVVKVSPDARDRASMLEGLSYAFESRWQEAARAFDNVPRQSSLTGNAIVCERLCARGAALKLKNPTKAGVLAVIPGLGYLYDGYERTALSAFVVNSLFIWGTYEAFHHDNPGLGTVLAFFGTGWYSGNIYGSIQSAKRQNARSHARLMAKFDIGFPF